MQEAKLKNKGLVVAYYGDGKGKTTAALGIALRAAGRRMNVKVLQFIKGDPTINKKSGAVVWATGEREFAQQYQSGTLGKIEIEAVGTGFVKIKGDGLSFVEHKKKAQIALKKAKTAVRSREWQIVVLDEILGAIDEKLIMTKDVLNLIRIKSAGKFLILTGHRLPKSVLNKVDLVTEMKKIKHPFDKGILAQKGIDY